MGVSGWGGKLCLSSMKLIVVECFGFSLQIMGSGMPSAQAAFNLFAAALTCLLPLYFMQEVSPLCLGSALAMASSPAMLPHAALSCIPQC